MAKTKKSAKMEKPVWLKLSEDDMKKIISELAGKHQPAQIGLILRDQYGIPTTKIFGKRLSVYLKELGIETKADLVNAEKKFDKLKEHMKKHITDKKAKHKSQKAHSNLIKLKQYHSR